MGCFDTTTFLILVQVIITISLACVVLITGYILLSSRRKVFAYQLILWITGSQSFVYLAIYPYRWTVNHSRLVCAT